MMQGKHTPLEVSCPLKFLKRIFQLKAKILHQTHIISLCSYGQLCVHSIIPSVKVTVKMFIYFVDVNSTLGILMCGSLPWLNFIRQDIILCLRAHFYSDNLFVSSATIWRISLRWGLIDVSISSIFLLKYVSRV